MKSVDKLRMIAKCADPRTAYQIESWINTHLLEFGNSYVVDEQLLKQSVIGEEKHLKYLADKALSELASTIIQKGSCVKEIPFPGYPTFVKDNNTPITASPVVRKYERRITIVMEEE